MVGGAGHVETLRAAHSVNHSVDLAAGSALVENGDALSNAFARVHFAGDFGYDCYFDMNTTNIIFSWGHAISGLDQWGARGGGACSPPPSTRTGAWRRW